MQEHELPTAAEMFRRASGCVDQAYVSLGDASDWLRSDWRPLGSSLTNEQGNTRSEVFDLLREAKDKLNEVQAKLSDAGPLHQP